MQGLVRAVVLGAVLLRAIIGGGARADVASDQAAAILVFPKIIVDATNPPNTKRGPIDTLIRVSNTSDSPVAMNCFYINANGHCNSSGKICNPYDGSGPQTCVSPDFCQVGWQETDFTVTLTARQPIAWLASTGAVSCGDPSHPLRPCFPVFSGIQQPPNSIQPVSEDPFIGMLECIEVDFNGVPVARNDLKGEAQFVRSSTSPDALDVETYNAIGIPAIPGNNDSDSTLVLGGGVCVGGSTPGAACASATACPGGRCTAEYSGCPNILVLDHFFDGAIDPVSGRVVTTTLTMVPCTEDFNAQPISFIFQVLVFNEYEQRFSTRANLTCFGDFRLTDIDASSPNRSIFSAAVNGTLTGQTRLRGVDGGNSRYGYTMLGVAEEFRQGGGTAAFNLHFQGTRAESDFVYLPQQQ